MSHHQNHHNVAKLLSSLRECTKLGLVKEGRILHQRVIFLGLQYNIPLCKSLINFYLSLNQHSSAISVLHSIHDKASDISLWNTLISFSSKNSFFFLSISLFQSILYSPHVSPDSFTLPSVFKSFGALSFTIPGMSAHSYSVKAGFFSDVVVASSAMAMYAKFGFFDSVLKVFDEMPTACRDVGSWNTVISSYYHDGECRRALEVFDDMRRFGAEPDSTTLTTVIASCARLCDVARGMGIYREVVGNGVVVDEYVGAALVDMYWKFGFLEMAEEVFERVGQRTNVVLWNTMIAGYGSRGDARSGLRILLKMVDAGLRPTRTTLSSLVMACSRSACLRIGKFVHGYAIRNRMTADVYLDVALVDLYFKCGSVKSAGFIFRGMPKEDVVSWNVMISGFVSTGGYFEALEVYNDMVACRVGLDAITLTSLLTACANLGALERGVEIHKHVVEGKFESNQVVMGALLDMYSKCGAVDEARHVFDRLIERDVVSWTTMITAYGSHGRTSEAIELFQMMEEDGVTPDKVTFIGLISACGHGGFVGEGYFYFKMMISKYGIMPTIELYSCLVDILGRSGRVREAYMILRRAAPPVRDDLGLLSTLLSACSLHGDLYLGEEIARMLIDKDPDDPSTYIVLSRLYASAGKWGEAREVRSRMDELNLRKNPGCSWVEVDKKIHHFFVDRYTSNRGTSSYIFGCLEILSAHMENDEHTFQTLS